MLRYTWSPLAAGCCWRLRPCPSLPSVSVLRPGREPAAKWLQGELVYLADSVGKDHTCSKKKKKFSIILQNWLVLRPDGYKTQPGRELGTRTVGSQDSSFCSSLQLCWIRRNIKSYRWPYKNTVKVMCELYGWCVVGFLYVAEFCCLKNSIPVESRTSTMLTASDNSYQWVQFDDFIWLVLNILNLLNEWAVMPAVW